MKRIHGGAGAPGEGQGYPPHSAVFLEFHEPHAAWLHPWGAEEEDSTILGSGEMYHNFTKVVFTYKEQR